MFRVFFVSVVGRDGSERGFASVIVFFWGFWRRVRGRIYVFDGKVGGVCVCME